MENKKITKHEAAVALGSRGGKACVRIYGKEHMSALGRKSARARKRNEKA